MLSKYWKFIAIIKGKCYIIYKFLNKGDDTDGKRSGMRYDGR